MKRHRFQHLAVLAAIAGLVTAACVGGQAGPSPTATPTPGQTGAGASPTPTAPPEVAQLKVASFGSISDAPFFIARDKGYFEEEFIEVELVPSQNAAQGITFLGSGQVEVAGLAATPGFFNAILDGFNVKIVADKGQIGPDNSYVTLVVRKDLYDEGVTSVADLRGRTVGVSGLETGTGAELALTLREAGLTIDDINLVPGSPPDGFSGLLGGALDAAVLQEPFLARALADDEAVILRKFGEVVPNGQNGVVAFGERMLADPELSARFMRAYLKAVADFKAAFPTDGSSPQGKDEIVAILVENTPVKDAALYDTMQMPLFTDDGSIDTESVDLFQEFFIEKGLQREFVPASDYFQRIPVD